MRKREKRKRRREGGFSPSLEASSPAMLSTVISSCYGGVRKKKKNTKYKIQNTKYKIQNKK